MRAKVWQPFLTLLARSAPSDNPHEGGCVSRARVNCSSYALPSLVRTPRRDALQTDVKLHSSKC